MLYTYYIRLIRLNFVIIVLFFILVSTSYNLTIAYGNNSESNTPDKTSNAAKDPDYEAIYKHPLGSFENPIRVYSPVGQRNYLSRLVCTNGNHPINFERGGSVGIGPYGNMLDVYNVKCGEKETEKFNVYMDMYHKDNIETRPAEGFIGLDEK